MKRLAIAYGVLFLAVFTMFVAKDKKQKKSKKDKNFLAVESSGPNGQPILSGADGVKYYMKGDKKVYLRKVK